MSDLMHFPWLTITTFVPSAGALLILLARTLARGYD